MKKNVMLFLNLNAFFSISIRPVYLRLFFCWFITSAHVRICTTVRKHLSKHVTTVSVLKRTTTICTHFCTSVREHIITFTAAYAKVLLHLHFAKMSRLSRCSGAQEFLDPMREFTDRNELTVLF